MDARRGWSLWSNRLWFLAAVLGATSIYYGAAEIHDRTRGRTVVHMVAQSMAGHVTSMASARLEVLAAPTFAPATHAPAGGAGTALDALISEQRRGLSCRCRDLLPAVAFFRFDPTAPRFTLQYVHPPFREIAPVPVLQELAASAAARYTGADKSSVHLRTDPRLGDFTMVMYAADSASAGARILYGLLAPTPALMGRLFRHHMMAGPGDDPGLGLAHMDTLSLHVATIDSAAKFGTLSDERRYRATVTGSGPFDGLAVTIALQPSQIEMPLMVLMPHARLWRLGVMMLATIIVLVIAVGSSRRELLLARARSDFIAGVSHDLRMPLAQILLAGETISLERTKDETERRSLAASIVREARRLNALIDNVLLFSRDGSGAPKPVLQPVDVAASFHDVIEGVELAVADAGQRIERMQPTTLTVLAERSLLQQALVNLVDNAIKYGKPGQCIRLSADAHGSDRVRLYVDDQGPGVPHADRARVFDAYERLAHDQVSERTGAGLGLAVVKQIARACGGDVWLDDAPGGGTRAVLELRAASVA